jgi:hypothetical protein
MSKWCCQLPWVAACGLALTFGALMLASYLFRWTDRPPAEAKEMGGVGVLLVIVGGVGIAGWVVVAFVA